MIRGVSVVLILGLLLTSSAYFVPDTSASSSSSSQSGPIFVWFFGYVGSTFYPTTQLNISQQQMIEVAANMSKSIGSTTRLRFVSAVDQLPGSINAIINWDNATLIQNIRDYVGNLSLYGQVYGRIDLQQFNSTSQFTVFQEVGNFSTILNIAGIWFDHAAVVYGNNTNSHSSFNTMMQTLVSMFPNMTFILNQSTKGPSGGQIIVPGTGTTWNRTTYISPSVPIGKYSIPPGQKSLLAYNKYFHGHVLLHFDAYALNPREPMGIFARQNRTNEISAINHLALLGMQYNLKKEGYILLYPVIGAWTYKFASTNGTLYNSLQIGKYAHMTLGNFITTMIKYS